MPFYRKYVDDIDGIDKTWIKSVARFLSTFSIHRDPPSHWIPINGKLNREWNLVGKQKS